MENGFRLVFHEGAHSNILPDAQIHAAIARVLELDEAQLQRLLTEQAFTLKPGLSRASALHCVGYLQKLGLGVTLEHKPVSAEPDTPARWLSDSGFGSGFTQTQLNMQRAESLLQSYTVDTENRPPFVGDEIAAGKERKQS